MYPTQPHKKKIKLKRFSHPSLNGYLQENKGLGAKLKWQCELFNRCEALGLIPNMEGVGWRLMQIHTSPPTWKSAWRRFPQKP
jgi:hypothetical protein